MVSPSTFILHPSTDHPSRYALATFRIFAHDRRDYHDNTARSETSTVEIHSPTFLQSKPPRTGTAIQIALPTAPRLRATGFSLSVRDPHCNRIDSKSFHLGRGGRSDGVLHRLEIQRHTTEPLTCRRLLSVVREDTQTHSATTPCVRVWWEAARLGARWDRRYRTLSTLDRTWLCLVSVLNAGNGLPDQG